MFRAIGIIIVIIGIIAFFGLDVHYYWNDILRPGIIYVWNTIEAIILWGIDFFVSLIK